jgi:signal transduction histidine kinase
MSPQRTACDAGLAADQHGTAGFEGSFMHRFLANNRDELIARCKAKVAQRPLRQATADQLANGVPMFLDQLVTTLRAEHDGEPEESLRISGAAGGDATALSEIGVSAAAHGRQLLALGYSVDQVVHDYGDLCQAITDLAVERDAPFAVDEFRTLNRCLDNAIADAVTEFIKLRDAAVASGHSAESKEQLGQLAHELRNYLHAATMSFSALESGRLPVGGSTGALLKRSLVGMSVLLDRALEQVHSGSSGSASPSEIFAVAGFVADADSVASLHAHARGCTFVVAEVDPLLKVRGNRELLMAALVNVLHNAFKFTQANSRVLLEVRATDDHVCIDVEDRCGGLPPGSSEVMFLPFTQLGDDRSGIGLGLPIARRSVQADGGQLSVRDKPGKGCVFTLQLPRHTAE